MSARVAVAPGGSHEDESAEVECAGLELGSRPARAAFLATVFSALHKVDSSQTVVWRAADSVSHEPSKVVSPLASPLYTALERST